MPNWRVKYNAKIRVLGSVNRENDKRTKRQSVRIHCPGTYLAKSVLLCQNCHCGQNKAKQEIKCKNCLEHGHYARNCKNDKRCKVCKKLVVSPVRKNASNTRKIVRISLLSMVIKICCQIFIPLTLTVEIINLQSTRSSWQRHCATVISMLLSVTEVWIRHSMLNVSAIQSTHSAWETEKVEVMTIVVEA